MSVVDQGRTSLADYWCMGHLLWQVCVLALPPDRQGGVWHLVVAYPDAVVKHRKGDDVVEEGFGLVVPFGHSKGVGEHLFEDLEMRLLIKALQSLYR